MRTAIFIGVLLGMLGCGGASETPAVPVDAGVDVGDACVMAQGNCGCVFEETINYGPDGGITTKVVCP